MQCTVRLRQICARASEHYWKRIIIIILFSLDYRHNNVILERRERQITDDDAIKLGGSNEYRCNNIIHIF